MKIPLEWLKEYIKTDKSTAELAKSFTLLGLMQDKPATSYQDGNYKTEILDLEHRMDRSDWLSIIGCARDLAAFEKTELIYPGLHTKPGKQPPKDTIIDIKVECPDIVKRFSTVVLRGVKVGKSPDWLRNRLEAYGIPSINNIVDITNYVMVEFGQPMHAQDIDKMEKPEIVIRRAREKETITTLLGETLTLTSDNFVLTQNGKATVLGGIVGGQDTGIDSRTKNVVLDAGNYDQNNIRKNSRRLKIQNETVLRYDKYLHPQLTEISLQRAIGLILQLAGGEYFENSDWYPNPQKPKNMGLRYARIKKVAGVQIPENQIISTLQSLEYKILSQNENSLIVEVPYFRTDVEVEDDLVADILRVGDYNNIPTLMIPEAPPVEITPQIYNFEDKLRDICVRIGMQEQITEPLVCHNPNDPLMIKLENSHSSDKNALRTTMLTTLQQVADVFKKNQNRVNIFEVGKIYTNISGVSDGCSPETYTETRVLEVLMEDSSASYKDNADEVKACLRTLLSCLRIRNYVVTVKNDMYLVRIGDSPKPIGEIRINGFTIYTEELLDMLKQDFNIEPETGHTDLPELSGEDISVVFPTDVKLGNLYEQILKLSSYPESVNTSCNFTLGNVPKEFGLNKKNLIISIKSSRDKIAGWKADIIALIEKNPDFLIRR